jgi:hypothetical protein
MSRMLNSNHLSDPASATTYPFWRYGSLVGHVLDHRGNPVNLGHTFSRIGCLLLPACRLLHSRQPPLNKRCNNSVQKIRFLDLDTRFVGDEFAPECVNRLIYGHTFFEVTLNR